MDKVAQPKTEFTKDDERRMAEHGASRARENGLEACLEALKMMRQFLDDAEREIKYVAKLHPDQHETTVRLVALPARVLHEMAWGTANASSSIETAMRQFNEYQSMLARVRELSK